MIKKSFVKSIFMMTVGAQVALSVFGSGQSYASTMTCRRVFLEEFEETADLFQNSPYSVLLSKDMNLLRSNRFSAEPGPQGNMSRESLYEQFYFNDEAAEVFKIRKRLLYLASRKENLIQVLQGREASVLAAAKEQFEFIFAELPLAFPDSFAIEGDLIVNKITGDSFSKGDFEKLEDPVRAIEVLSLFVTEDLVFLQKRPGTEDFMVVAGIIATPTHIAIEPILGEGILAIHQNVSSDPIKAKAFAAMINSALNRLFLGPISLVRRNNLSLENDPSLSIPYFRESAYPIVEKTTKADFLATRFIRTERQTLRALPKAQTVVFTIKPMVYSLGQLSMDTPLANAVLANLQAKYRNRKENPSFVNRAMDLFAEFLLKLQPISAGLE